MSMTKNRVYATLSISRLFLHLNPSKTHMLEEVTEIYRRTLQVMRLLVMDISLILIDDG